MSRLGKFFIICGAVCVVGIIMAAAGFAMGGVDDMQKVAERYDWLSAGPGEMQTQTTASMEFDAIETHGDMDLLIVGPGHEGFIEEGTVMIRYGEAVGRPSVDVEKGVLRIESKVMDEQMEVNLSGEDTVPDVIICCGKDALKSISVDNDCGDVTIAGASCSGAVNVVSDVGDIEFATGQAQSEYAVSLATNVGDIEIGESDLEMTDYTSEGGPGQLTLKTDVGDISVQFEAQTGLEL